MTEKGVIFLVFFLSLFSFICSSSEDPVTNPLEWTPDSLYNYVSNTYLNHNNPKFQQNMKHLIVDPENYLRYADLREANKYMDYLYNNFNISSHIFFISHMKSKFKLDEEIAEFVSKLSYYLYKTYDEYDEKLTLTTVFFIKDRKMRIRTSKTLREVLSDYDCLNILNKRKFDLKNNNFQEVVNGLVKDIYNSYKIRTENHEPIDNNFVLYTIIFIAIIAIAFFLLNQEKPSQQEDKVKAFLDKLKKRNNPKEIFTESCIICLGNFLSTEKIRELEKSGIKEQFEKEETSVLECGHKFHRKCIADWLKKEANCPFCRMKFDIKDSDNKDKNSFNSNNLNINFSNILSEILRIQSDINLLNEREVRRIRNYYTPSNRGSSHDKDYSSFKEGSGGATSGW